MSLEGFDIINLEDLDMLRSAPNLNERQSKTLLNQLDKIINKTDWFTIGVMSPTLKKGIDAIRSIEKKYKLNAMKCITLPTTSGPIFLKANQKTGEIHARIEFGLGEGILLSCHNEESSELTRTIGPFPLDFFY